MPSPVVYAADGRDLLANAITNTRGSYLVYNFGPGHPAPMQDAEGHWYQMPNGGHLIILKHASSRLSPHLLVDTHRGYQSRCERDPRARTHEGLVQSAEIYPPLQAWRMLGQPTVAINANFFDIRGQRSGSWKTTGCSTPLGTYVDNTRGQGRSNLLVTGTIPYVGKQGLSNGNEQWATLATMVLPIHGSPYVIWPQGGRDGHDYDAAGPTIINLVNRGERFVAVAGLGLLSPQFRGQLNDGGPLAARTALAYSHHKDEMYIFQGGRYTPDNMQDLFRGLGSDQALLLDGGGSSSLILRRDTGGMWAGDGSPRGSCDTRQVLCDARERALPGWLAFS